MSSPASLYYIGPPGPVREACLGAGDDVRVFDDVAAFSAVEGKVPGLVVLAHELQARAISVAADLCDAGPGWILTVAGGEDPVVLRSVSLGLPMPAEALPDHLKEEPGWKTTLVDLREALVQIGRTRHDVNNPLTAAFAEIQILLMDAVEGTEDHESLVVVQEQLRRIRDLVASTGHLRPPGTDRRVGE